MRYLLFTSLFLLSSCGTFQKIALRSTTPMFVESSQKMTLEKNWDFFRESASGNLKMTEMLYLQDPGNEELLSVVIKGYAGYGFAVSETLAFADELKGSESSHQKQQAIFHYTTALDYGVSYLEKKGINRKQLLTLEEGKFTELLKKELDDDDHAAVLFTAQAWGSLINLQKDNVALVSLVPRVKLLFDWVCSENPNIENGVCDIFYAQYEASRPRMLGGNPKKARELYQQAFKKHPRHLLIRLSYLQYMVLPAFDQEAYDREAKILRKEFAKWQDLNRDELKNQSEYKSAEELNLYNSIAKKRFEIMEKYKKKIFEG